MLKYCFFGKFTNPWIQDLWEENLSLALRTPQRTLGKYFNSSKRKVGLTCKYKMPLVDPNKFFAFFAYDLKN